MRRIRSLGRDVAHYFGFGGRSDQDPSQDARWVSIAVGVMPVLILLLWVKHLLGLDDNGLTDFLLTLAAAIVLGLVWGVALRLLLSLARRRRSE